MHETQWVEIACPTCGVLFAIPEELDLRYRISEKDFYGPCGHTITYGERKKRKQKATAKKAKK